MRHADGYHAMKLPRLITRRRLKWAGTAIGTLTAILCVFALLFHTQVDYRRSSQPKRVVMTTQGVAVGFVWDSGMQMGSQGVGSWWYIEWEDEWRLILRPRLAQVGPRHALIIPLLWPLLLIAAPTAWLWYTDRRTKPWQCAKCRYDLRGLDGGVCPECGEGGVN